MLIFQQKIFNKEELKLVLTLVNNCAACFVRRRNNLATIASILKFWAKKAEKVGEIYFVILTGNNLSTVLSLLSNTKDSLAVATSCIKRATDYIRTTRRNNPESDELSLIAKMLITAVINKAEVFRIDNKYEKSEKLLEKALALNQSFLNNNEQIEKAILNQKLKLKKITPKLKQKSKKRNQSAKVRNRSHEKNRNKSPEFRIKKNFRKFGKPDQPINIKYKKPGSSYNISPEMQKLYERPLLISGEYSSQIQQGQNPKMFNYSDINQKQYGNFISPQYPQKIIGNTYDRIRNRKTPKRARTRPRQRNKLSSSLNPASQSKIREQYRRNLAEMKKMGKTLKKELGKLKNLSKKKKKRNIIDETLEEISEDDLNRELMEKMKQISREQQAWKEQRERISTKLEKLENTFNNYTQAPPQRHSTMHIHNVPYQETKPVAKNNCLNLRLDDLGKKININSGTPQRRVRIGAEGSETEFQNEESVEFSQSYNAILMVNNSKKSLNQNPLPTSVSAFKRDNSPVISGYYDETPKRPTDEPEKGFGNTLDIVNRKAQFQVPKRGNSSSISINNKINSYESYNSGQLSNRQNSNKFYDPYLKYSLLMENKRNRYPNCCSKIIFINENFYEFNFIVNGGSGNVNLEIQTNLLNDDLSFKNNEQTLNMTETQIVFLFDQIPMEDVLPDHLPITSMRTLTEIVYFGMSHFVSVIIYLK